MLNNNKTKTLVRFSVFVAFVTVSFMAPPYIVRSTYQNSCNPRFWM